MINTLLIALAIIGSIALIVGLLIHTTKKQARARTAVMWETYKSLLTQYNITPDQVAAYPQRILAIDTERRVFLFVQQDGARPYGVQPLADVRECKVSNTGMVISATRKSGKELNEEYISGISLSLLLEDGSRFSVPVYTEILDGIGERETLRAAAIKWQEQINGLIGRHYSLRTV